MDIPPESALIKKETLSAGSKYVPMTKGTRVKFHYQTRRASSPGDSPTIIDDSRKCNRPMELVLGKQFKFEVWEVIVQKMSLNEVAKFTVDKSLCQQYPFISKTIRDAHKAPEERKHCCGMTLQNEGLGYKDLDDLFKSPSDLEFIIDLFSVERPEDYERASWQLNDDEKVSTVAELRERGNAKYKEGKYAEAMTDYEQALGMLEQLMLKEKPQDTEWLGLFEKKKPVLLNYAQCKLMVNEYYPAIEHCTEVLKQEPDNVKALYRRAKAYSGAWSFEEARRDYARVMELDPLLVDSVKKELSRLAAIEKARDQEDKDKYKKLFSK